jgi:micrococcal nuclease
VATGSTGRGQGLWARLGRWLRASGPVVGILVGAAVGLLGVIHLFFGWGAAWAERGHAGEVLHPEAPIPARVVRVVDGDTFIVAVGGAPAASVRLIGVDAPERSHPTRGPEPYGEAAARFLQELLPPGTIVRLELDAEVADTNGRLLAYAYLPDGRMVNEVLLEEGYAQLYTFPPNIRYVDRLLRAQRAGREANRGLWALNGPAPDGSGEGGPPRVQVASVNLEAEWVEIWNGGTEPVDLTGWVLVSLRGDQRFAFPEGFVLAPGAAVTITSGRAFRHQPPEVLGWTEKDVWNNAGDPAVLVDPAGREVHRFP